MYKRRTFWLAIVLVMGLSSVQAKDPSHVAVMLPLTGPYGPLGNRLLGAFEFTFFGMKAPFVVDVYDTQGTPQGAKAAMEVLLKKPVKPVFIVGPLLSPEISAIMPLSQKQGLPLLTLSNDEAVAAPLVYVFGVSPRQQVLMAQGLFQRQGLSHLLLVLRRGSSYSQPFLEAAQKVLKNIHMTVAWLEPHAKTLSASEWAGLKGRFFDVVWAPGIGKDVSSLGPQLAPLFPGKKPPFISSDDWYHQDYLKNPLLKNSWFLGPEPVKREKVMKAYQTVFQRPATSPELLMVDAATILLSVLMKHQGALAYGVLARSEGFNGLHGQTILSPTGLVERRAPILEVAGDGMVRIYALPPVSA